MTPARKFLVTPGALRTRPPPLSTPVRPRHRSEPEVSLVRELGFDPRADGVPVSPSRFSCQRSSRSPLDLIRPCLLRIRVRIAIDARNDLGRQIRTLVDGQLQGFLQDATCLFAHFGIVALRPWQAGTTPVSTAGAPYPRHWEPSVALPGARNGVKHQ